MDDTTVGVDYHPQCFIINPQPTPLRCGLLAKTHGSDKIYSKLFASHTGNSRVVAACMWILTEKTYVSHYEIHRKSWVEIGEYMY